MKTTYFVLFSNKLNYPIYLGFYGIVSLHMLRNLEETWKIINHITSLNYDDFVIISKCPRVWFEHAFIKFDFRFK